MARSTRAWPGRLFLDIGRALYVGPAFDTTLHAHHAIQVCVGVNSRFRLRSSPGAAWSAFSGARIAANHSHQLDAQGEVLVIAYIEPEGRDGRRLDLAVGGIAPLPTTVASGVRRALRAAEQTLSPEAADGLYGQFVREFGLSESTSAPLDERIALALGMLRGLTAELPPSSELARTVGLSPTRFRHLFSSELGLSYRRYLLWRKLYAAAGYLAANESLTSAAHDAGFSDSSHLTRTFRRMFGIAPSLIPREMWSFPPQRASSATPGA